MQFSLEPQAAFQRNYLHSRMITIFRGLAALEVFLGHMRNQFFPDYKSVLHPSLPFKALVFSTGYGPQAVILFFVMSGWLVGGALWNRRHDRQVLGPYFIDRVSRLWMVLIPTMLVSLMVGLILNFWMGVHDLIPMSDLGPVTFLGNLAGLQNFYVPDYGNNLALWSLANESWYYVAFPLILLPLAGQFSARGKAAALVGLLAIGALLPGKLVLYFLIWLVGAFFSRVTIALKPPLIALSFVILLAASLIIRWHRWDGNFAPDFAVAVLFAVFLCATKFAVGEWNSPPFRWAEKLSDMSYSLYAVHIPAMFWVVGAAGLAGKTLDQSSAMDWLAFTGFLAAVFTFAYYFHSAFEAKTYMVRRHLKGYL